MSMFADPEVKMIVANRGGYGCNRLVDLVLDCITLAFFFFFWPCFHSYQKLCASLLPNALLTILSLQLNYTVIAQNPKVIMGYSDLTALLNAIHVSTGLITFHGYTYLLFIGLLFLNSSSCYSTDTSTGLWA